MRAASGIACLLTQHRVLDIYCTIGMYHVLAFNCFAVVNASNLEAEGAGGLEIQRANNACEGALQERQRRMEGIL